jgi:hypothetical protein
MLHRKTACCNAKQHAATGHTMLQRKAACCGTAAPDAAAMPHSHPRGAEHVVRCFAASCAPCRREPSSGADVAGVSPVLVQMWEG